MSASSLIRRPGQALLYLIAAIAILAATALALLADRVPISVTYVEAMYFLVVVASAYWLGAGPASLTLVAAAAALVYVYVSQDADLISTVVRFVVVLTALSVGLMLTRSLRRHQARAVSVNTDLSLQNAELQTQQDLLREQTGELATQAQQLTEREGRLRSVMDKLDEGVIVLDPSGRVLACNLAALRMHDNHGLQIGQIPTPYREGVYEITTPDGRSSTFEAGPIADLLRGDELLDYEIVVRDSSRNCQRVLSYGSARIYDAHGEPALSVLTVRDITQRKKAETDRERLLAEVQRSATEIETVVESMADAVFVCDPLGKITLINKAGRDLINLEYATGSETLTDYLRALQLHFPEGDPIPFEELAISRALRGMVERDREEVAFSPLNGDRIDLLLSAAPICGEDGRISGAVAIARDATELRELDRLKDEFIAVAAHELKTPVTIMKGYAQLLMRRSELPPEVCTMLGAIDNGADRIDSLVQDLLDVSLLHFDRMELATEVVDLPVLAMAVLERFKVTLTSHRVQLVMADPAIIAGDPRRLEQVLTNLVDNAVKYSPAGGDIDVAVQAMEREAVVSVKDRGVGIPKGRRAAMFARFFSAHRGSQHVYGGMGVGLFISKNIVERHGGRIWFDSEEGKGSIFYFSLPLR